MHLTATFVHNWPVRVGIPLTITCPDMTPNDINWNTKPLQRSSHFGMNNCECDLNLFAAGNLNKTVGHWELHWEFLLSYNIYWSAVLVFYVKYINIQNINFLNCLSDTLLHAAAPVATWSRLLTSKSLIEVGSNLGGSMGILCYVINRICAKLAGEGAGDRAFLPQ